MSDVMDNVANYTRISDRFAMGGQPSKKQIRDMKKAGVEVLIKLQVHEAVDGLPDEADTAHEVNLQYVSIPVSFAKPTKAQLAVFFEVMERYKDSNVFVHCVGGLCASGFVFLYLTTKMKMPVEDVQFQLKSICTPNDTWLKFVNEILSESGIDPIKQGHLNQ